MATLMQVRGRRAIKVLMLQVYLSCKKPPTPKEHQRALGMGLLYGPRGGRFLMRVVPRCL